MKRRYSWSDDNVRFRDTSPASRNVSPGGLSATHLLNDTIQSLIPAIYPIIKQSYQLDYVQIGLISLTFQISPRCSSLCRLRD